MFKILIDFQRKKKILSNCELRDVFRISPTEKMFIWITYCRKLQRFISAVLIFWVSANISYHQYHLECDKPKGSGNIRENPK